VGLSVVRVADERIAARLQTERPVGAAGLGHLRERKRPGRDLMVTSAGGRRHQFHKRDRGRHAQLRARLDRLARSGERRLIPAEPVEQHRLHPPGGDHADPLAPPLDLRGRRRNEISGLVVTLPGREQLRRVGRFPDVGPLGDRRELREQ
jgi:hypothetical protein